MLIKIKLKSLMNLKKRMIRKLNIILISHYRIAAVYSFSNYSKIFGDLQFISLENNRTTTVFPIQFFNDIEKLPLECNLPDTYFSKIRECKIIGQSNVILTKNGYLLYDYLSDISKSHVNVTDGGLLLLLNKVLHFKKYYIVNYIQESKDKIENGIMLSGNFSNNYYHFVFEFLVKFELISNLMIDKRIPIILDNQVKEFPQFIDLISIFNRENRQIIYIKKDSLYSIKELYYFSFINEIPPNLKRKINNIESTDYAFDFKSIDFLRTIMDKYFNGISLKSPKKIFISRSSCSIRRNNEHEIFPILAEHGFVVIQPERMSVKEQYFHFSNAQHIIAASGAALTNIVFCKPDCKILVFQSVKSQITVFSSIAAYIKTNMIYITADTDQLKSHPDFNIPKELLKQYLSKYDFI